jgi:hypothetical protein
MTGLAADGAGRSGGPFFVGAASCGCVVEGGVVGAVVVGEGGGLPPVTCERGTLET